MSIYVLSDVHGEYEKFIKSIELINLNSNDTVYILGDIVDRGNGGIKILQHIICDPRYIPILGNHEYMAVNILKILNQEITEENIENFDINFLAGFREWIDNGGQCTLDEFMNLTKEERKDILDFLEDFQLFDEITVNKKNYILVHAGLDNFSSTRNLNDYKIHELIFNSINYDKMYFKDKIIITGHTPTFTFSESNKIYKRKNHIAIDCGCGFGGKLAVYCLDTEVEIYV